MSKGQGISINMIIITAIALVVLIIAVVLVTKAGRNADQNAGTKSCIASGGVCKTACAEGEVNIIGPNNGITCPATASLCCRYDFNG
jgi:uncharacterized membrane protein